MTARKPSFPPTWMPGSKSYAPLWPRPSGAVMPLSLSSGSRDSFLPRKAFRWNQHPESRQAVLAEAIQRGVVLTSKIANPKTPAYPTTTIRLNRAEAGIPEEAQRFHPVALTGESIAEAIEVERGNM